jgi:hypothetical protein
VLLEWLVEQELVVRRAVVLVVVEVEYCPELEVLVVHLQAYLLQDKVVALVVVVKVVVVIQAVLEVLAVQ